MNESYYSVEQVAQMLHMHAKTIQRYIREGRLRAAKIGKSWHISGHDLSSFVEANRQTAADSIPQPPARERTKASAVIDITVVCREDADRLIHALHAAMNDKPLEYGQSSMVAQYLAAESAVRLTLWGNLPFMAAVFSLVEMYIKRYAEEELCGR